MTSSAVDTSKAGDEKVTRQQWKWTVLAAMASYIDAGSIVAGAIGLALWAQYLHMGSFVVGLLGALSSNAISTAAGALIGGRLGDRFGRKRIYSFDLLVYAFGVLWIIFAVQIWMLFVGYILIGLAVGADVPTSWALVGEFSPNRARSKLLGFTQVFWSIGPIVSLVLGLVLAPEGVLGVRIIFVQLFIVALVTWALRRGMVESARWRAAIESSAAAPVAERGNPLSARRIRDLFTGPSLRGLLFTAVVYTCWNTAAGTYGFFGPYILKTVGSQSQAASVALSGLGFVLTILGCVFIFMPYGDGSHRRLIYGVGAVAQVVAFLLFILFPLTLPVAIVNFVLFGIGGSLAGEPFYRVWSQELFPTMLRGTAQGITFAIARTEIGIWSIFVPVLAASGGFKTMSAILMALLLVSGVVGWLFMPNTAGKSLEQIQEELARSMAGASESA
jgi:inositol transporter-like SP family MFS transporter